MSSFHQKNWVQREAARYKCVPEGMVLHDYVRGYKQISQVRIAKTDEDQWGGVHPEQLGIKNLRKPVGVDKGETASSRLASRWLAGGSYYRWTAGLRGLRTAQKKPPKTMKLFQTRPRDDEPKKKTARKDALGPELVAQYRREFLMFMKNVASGAFNRDYETLERFRQALYGWATVFEDYGKQIREDLRGRIRVWENSDYPPDGALAWAKAYETDRMKPFWDFLFEFRHGLAYTDVDKGRKYQGQYGYDEQRELEKLTEEGRKWVNRAKQKALKAWAYLTELSEWAAGTGLWGGGGEAVDLITTEKEIVELEGFRTRFEGYDDSDSKEYLPALKEGLRIYRKQAEKVFPWLLRNQLPLVIRWTRGSSTAAATYNKSHIEIHPWGISGDPRNFAKTMAHEMGHHAWQAMASKKMQDFWETAIKGDYTDLNLRDLVASGIQLLDSRSQQSHPILSLQWETLLNSHRYKAFDLFSINAVEEYLAAGNDPIVRVPASPITGYAGKNSEEAFCEAVGMLVAYGPRAVLPQVRGWLHTILGPSLKVGAVREACVAARYLERA